MLIQLANGTKYGGIVVYCTVQYMASCSISAELRLPNHNSSGRTALHRKRRSLFLSPDQIAGIHVPEANNGHGYGRAQFIPACAGTVLSQRCSGTGLCSPSRSYKKDPFLHSTPLVGPLLQRPPSVYNRAKNGPRPSYHDLAALTSYCSSFHTTVDSVRILPSRLDPSPRPHSVIGLLQSEHAVDVASVWIELDFETLLPQMSTVPVCVAANSQSHHDVTQKF